VSQENPERLAEIVDSFEWAMGSGDHVRIEADILAALEKSDLAGTSDNSRRVYRDLFAIVLRLLTTQGSKALTRELLVAETQTSTLTQSELLAAAHLREWIDNVDLVLERHERQIQELRERIPAERSKTFYVAEISPEHTSKDGPLFDFNQTLRGRQTRLSELDSFLNDPAKRIGFLSGRGGIGKTKLLRDWSQATAGWEVLWVSQHGVWHEGSPGEIPATDTVVIADDAHHYGDIDKLISLVSSRTGESRLKLLIATRPSGEPFLDEMLARLADSSSVARFKRLRSLKKTATVEIAGEMLGPKYEHLASRLAEVSKDTPLITVVGGKLIARGQIIPDLLANDREFRQLVFSKFHEERTGEFPSSGRSNSALLELIAAVQPIDDEGSDFVSRAAVFLAIRPDQIRRGLSDLEQREVLIRGGGKLRIVPDLFADYLLEIASIDARGRANGFADAVFTTFEEAQLSSLLKNFAELDWRITRSGSEARLLDNIWTSIVKRFRAQDAADRRYFLRTAQGIVVFQPANIQKLIQVAMDEPVPSVRKWGLIRSTQEHILAQLPTLLGVTIVNEDVSSDAFARLWQLALHESQEVSGPAQRTLKSAIGYEIYKHPIYNERVLEFVEHLAEDSTSYAADFTPLDLMDKLLDREIDVTEWEGGSISVSARPVPYDMIQALRERALRVVNHALYAGDPRIAARAAASLSSVLGEFHPKFRAGVTAEEQAWQDQERLGVLDTLRKRVEAEDVSLQLVWKIHRMLRWIGKRAGQSAIVRDGAAALQHNLSRPEFFELFDVLCTNEFEDNTEADGYNIPAQGRRGQQDSAIASLIARFSNVEDQVKVIEQLLQQAVDAGINPESVDPVLSQMCRNRRFLEGFSEYARQNPNSILASIAGIAVRVWRDRDLVQFARYGCLFAESLNLRTAGSVASSVAYGPPLDVPVPADLKILSVLARRKESYIIHPVFFGLRRLTKVEAFRAPALALITEVEIGNRHNLAKEYCDIFGPYGIPPGLLDGAGLERMLANLVAVEELDRDSFGGFLANVCGISPMGIVSFFEARIVHGRALEEGGQDTDYDAIPSSFSWSTFSAIRSHAEYENAFRGLVDLMKRYPRYEHELASIFWHMGTTDVATFTVLDELLHTSNPDDAAMLVRLLSEASVGLAVSHPAFAVHVLTECAGYSEDLERAAMGRLISNSFSAGGFQAVPPGGSITLVHAPSEVMKTTVESLLTNSQPGTLAYKLYAEIASVRTPVVRRSPDFDSEFEDGEEVDGE